MINIKDFGIGIKENFLANNGLDNKERAKIQSNENQFLVFNNDFSEKKKSKCCFDFSISKLIYPFLKLIRNFIKDHIFIFLSILPETNIEQSFKFISISIIKSLCSSYDLFNLKSFSEYVK